MSMCPIPRITVFNTWLRLRCNIFISSAGEKMYTNQHPMTITLVSTFIFVVVISSILNAITQTTAFINAFAQTGNNTQTNGYQLLAQWGSLSAQPGQLDGQNNAVGTAEFVYIADYNKERIQKFTSDGQFVKVWEVGWNLW